MIRPAEPSDSKFVVPLIIQAMDELAGKFANSSDPKIIEQLFEHFFKQKHNQYSYENTLVFIENDQVLGSINAYDGGKLFELRKTFLDHLTKNYNLLNFHPEPETEAGEFYLDTISVHPEAQGKGIGKALIKAGIEWGKSMGHKRIGLLVEMENQKALKLYQNKAFSIQNQKLFIGGLYYHMVYTIQ
ncbi:GNAT family N-acetyltransferase [Pedobacter sp. R20-19]|uniref:GNAT family N-acetyltransferase n=1 Tax=Pedobacter sp. R20-19 TaxID=1270196 RepID=UPI0004932EB4|nr:GNAT family N-acetyltransferase [Pedobacter sp. R20-19]